MIPAVLLLVGIAFQRPMIFGYYDAKVGLFLIILAGMSAAIKMVEKSTVPKENIRLAVICFGTALMYAAINAVSVGLSISVTALIISLTSIFSCFMVVSLYPQQSVFVTRNVLRLLILSNLITLIAVKFDVNQLDLVAFENFPVKDRRDIDSFDLLFPLSTIPYRMTLQTVILPRSTYLAIEPGVAVYILFLWRYLEGVTSKSKAIFLNCIFVAALASTSSTTGPLMLACWFAVQKFFSGTKLISVDKRSVGLNGKKFLTTSVILLLSVYLLFYAPFFGIIAKTDTHGASFSDRVSWYSSGGAIFRFMKIALLLLFYHLVKKYAIGISYVIPFSALFIVSVLNVLAFSPVFWLTTFLALAMLQGKGIRHSPPTRRPL